MTTTQFASLIRWKTRTTTVTFPDSELLLVANAKKDDIASRLNQIAEDHFGAVGYANLVAGQREYPLPPNLLTSIKRVEAMLDGTTFVPLTEFDLNQNKRATSETAIQGAFGNSASAAKYDIFRGSLWLYTGAITTVANGLKLWYFIYPDNLQSLVSDTDLSNDPTTTTFGIPRSLHELWADSVVIEYKNKQEKPIPLTQAEQNWDVRLMLKIRELTQPNLDRAINAELPESREISYNGFNY